ncbi:PREDICTED: protein PHLOEM PROTEIN 2-LIKE A5 [Tarenaya hassleriana]|uniref:protein PHLOEM PROTEIN 2-LIKE A5 n=1 Tax=Tarenaya hassleriana TaxID=28532 RepID=UPI00053CA452|nr:PREDICTED: protein PHLOEM PROTEIN 2-LIKE A5 [Tarenaya hassleriana]
MAIFSRPQHEVFINYRGDELRYGFVSHLVEALERNRVNFFIDKDEQRGKDLKDLFLRIDQSLIALVIFSRRYAESEWCLDELSRINKRVEMGKLRVIPIFYKVDADDVREQKGKFGDKFWELAKASRGHQIMEWKDALESVSDKMGLSLSDKSSESDFIKKIVEEVGRVLSDIPCDEGIRCHSFDFPEKKRRSSPIAPLYPQSFHSKRAKAKTL